MSTARSFTPPRRGYVLATLVALLATLGALALAGPAHAAKTSTKAGTPTAAQVKKCQAVLKRGSKASLAKKRACRVVLRKAARAKNAARATGAIEAAAATPPNGVCPTTNTLSPSTFEIDGNLMLDDGDCSDWETFVSGSFAPPQDVAAPLGEIDPYPDTGPTPSPDPDLRWQTDKLSGNGDDDIYSGADNDFPVSGGSVVLGNTADKTDLQRFYLATKTVSGTPFLYLAYVRAPVLNGTTAVYFELNQSTLKDANGIPVRTAGDKLIEFNFVGQSPAPLAVYTWQTSGTCEIASHSAPCWGGKAVLSATAFKTGINLQPGGAGSPPPVQFFDPIANANLVTDTSSLNKARDDDGRFGEAVINLTNAGIIPTTGCAGFGQAHVRSINGNAFNSSLADLIKPVPITVGNCRVEVKKALSPTNDPGRFNLLAKQGTTTIGSATNVGHNGTTGKVSITGSSVTVSEEAGTSPATSLDDYSTTYACTGTGSGNASGSGSTIPTFTGLQSGTDIVCTFTNTRKQGAIELRKDFVGTAGLVNLFIKQGQTTIDSELDAADNGTTGQNTVNTGSYDLSETAGTGTDLADHTSTLACFVDENNDGIKQDTEAAATVTSGAVSVGQNPDIVCTFTNTRKPDYVITKKANPNPAAFGQTITYTIEVSHIGENLPIDLTGFEVTDKFADQNITETLVRGDDRIGNNDNILTQGEFWVYGVLGPNEQVVPVTRAADVCGEIVNTATIAPQVREVTPADAQNPPVLDDPNNRFDTETVPVTCTPDLQVVKTGPAQVNFNDTITYQVAVSHAATSDKSPVAAADVKVTDPKVTPNQVLLVSGDDGDAILEAEETWIYKVTEALEVTLPANTCGPITNTAILAQVPGETNLANNESTATTNVICTLDVGIAKTSDKATYDAGQTINYSLTVTNSGQAAIPFSQIVVSDPMFTPTLQGTAPAELAPGASLTYVGTKTTAITDCAAGVTNTATVSLVGNTTPETTLANNTATRVVTVVCPAPPPVQIAGAPAKLSIDKRGPLSATAGQLATYRIKVTNTGRQDALNVIIRDTLPSGFTLARRAAGATFKGGVVTWKVGTLKPGASKSVNLTVRIASTVGGRRCNVGLARGSNVGQVRDAACTRIKTVAPAIAPAVTG